MPLQRSDAEENLTDEATRRLIRQLLQNLADWRTIPRQWC